MFDKENVKADVEKVLDEKLNNEKNIIDESDIERRIRANVEKKEGSLSAAQTDSLNIYIKKVQKMYVEKLHFPTESLMVTVINKTTDIAWIAFPLAIVIGFISAFYLIVSRHYAYHGMRFVIYGLLGAGTLITVGFSAIVSNGTFYEYNLTNSFMKEYYGYYVGHLMLIEVIYGIGLLVFGLISIFLVYRQKYAIRR